MIENFAYQFTEHFYKILAYNAAPTLMRLKPSSIICLSKNFLSYISTKKKYAFNFMNTNFYIRLLYVCKDKPIIMIYEQDSLIRTLCNKKVKLILKKAGYPTKSDDIEKMLGHLKIRLINYSQEQNSFPHEIGLFLGIPYRDVLDFINNSKRCHFCGYWKVYNNPNRAYRTMLLYRRAYEKIFYAKGKILS